MTSTNPLDNSSGGVLQTPSITQCNPSHLILSKHYTAINSSTPKHLIEEQENGRLFKQEFSSDVPSSEEWNRLVKALLKCWFILQALQESDLKEAIKELEDVADFYQGRVEFYAHQYEKPSLQSPKIKGKIKSVQVRPLLVLD